ncbi:MAG: discoidin domain-containing protein, partial [Planctomycetota bacterium]
AKPGKRSRSGNPQVAGFTYWTRGGDRPPSASMTAAGVGTLQVLEDLHGKKLGRQLTRQIAEGKRLGVGWLESDWSLTENRGHHEGQLLYYLWTVERLGAFLDREEFAGHPWYVEGATELLKRQQENGSWGSLHETCYALLFLARASRARVSSGRDQERGEGVHAWSEGPVHLRATGSMEITAWVQELELEQGDCVERVEWWINDERVASVPGDKEKAWRGERFPLRWKAPAEGIYKLRAEVSVVRVDDERTILRSGALELTCHMAPEEWIEQALPGIGPNLLLSAEVERKIEASSEAAGQFAARALDGFEGTAWIAAGSDAQPTWSLELKKPIKAKTVTFSQAASSFKGRTEFAGVTRVRLTVNDVSSEHELPAQAPSILSLPLPKPIRVRRLTIEILATDATQPARTGIAEIGLR